VAARRLAHPQVFLLLLLQQPLPGQDHLVDEQLAQLVSDGVVALSLLLLL